MLKLLRMMLFLAIALAGLAMIIHGTRGHHRWYLWGSMRLLLDGHPETLAVMPVGGRAPSLLYHRVTEGHEITFANPPVARNWIDPSRPFWVAHLPFSLQWTDHQTVGETTIEHELEISETNQTRTVPVKLQDLLTLGDQEWRVSQAGVWTGALPDAQGAPAGVLFFRKNDQPWEGPIALESRTLVTYGDLYLALKRHPDETTARRDCLLSMTPEPHWGVEDGDGRFHTLTSLLPGTGIDLSDGRSVTLVKYREDPPALLVEIEGPEGTRREVIPANADSSPVRFIAPGVARPVLGLHLWVDGVALPVWYDQGKALPLETVYEGERFMLPESDISCLLDTIRTAAIQVESADSPYQQLIFEREGELVRLREGERRQFGDAEVRYLPRVTRPPSRYTLVLAADDSPTSTVILGDGERIESGDYQIIALGVSARQRDHLELLINRRVPAWVTWLGIALLLGALPGIGPHLVSGVLSNLMLLWRPKHKPHSPTA